MKPALFSSLCAVMVCGLGSLFGPAACLAEENDILQFVTAGFHRRGPAHPAGGTQAWCIGENGLLNPLENGTELANQGDYPATLLGEESLGEGRFGTPLYSTGPAFIVEIEDLDVDLFDRRGEVGMRVYDANQAAGYINRENFRWVAVDGFCEGLGGEAEIMHLHDRGNAGGHIVATMRGARVEVEVADNPGVNPQHAPAPFGPGAELPYSALVIPGIGARSDKVYVDGQTAQVTVAVTPSFYASTLTNIEWDRVRTEPENFERQNPCGLPLTVESDPGDWSRATIPNVRWAKTESSCPNTTWVIDGTFTVVGLELSAASPGEMQAAVDKVSRFINGAARPERLVSGAPDIDTDRNAQGRWVVNGATIDTLRVDIQGKIISIRCLPESQFWDLTVKHELRHTIHYEQGKGPYADALDIQKAIDDALEVLNPPEGQQETFPSELHAERGFSWEFFTALNAQWTDITPPDSPAFCWKERDADAWAEIQTNKSFFFDIPCRYPGCVGVMPCDGCPPPDGTH